MFRLIPREEKFFDLLEELGCCPVEVAKLLGSMLHAPAQAKELYVQIKQLEEKADDYVRKIRVRLNKTFITPIDREDIALLTERLDDTVDGIDSVAHRAALIAGHLGNFSRFGYLLSRAEELVEVLVKSSSHLRPALGRLRDISSVESERSLIHGFENKGDAIWEGEGGVFDSFIAFLVKDTAQPLTKEDLLVAVWVEICHDLERTIDLVKNTVDAMSNVIDENA